MESFLKFSRVLKLLVHGKGRRIWSLFLEFGKVVGGLIVRSFESLSLWKFAISRENALFYGEFPDRMI